MTLFKIESPCTFEDHYIHGACEIYSSNGYAAGTALKAYWFSVAHNGASVAAVHMAVNIGCLEAFIITFIGSRNAFHALQSS